MTLDWQGAWAAVIHHPLFGIGITLGAYQLVLAGFEKTRWIFLQPVLVSMLLVIGVLLGCGLTYVEYRKSTEIMSILLGPATVALAVPLYLNLRRIRQLFWPIFTTLVVGGVLATGLCVLLGWWFGAEHMMLMTMAPKSVTSPIAMLVAEQIGGEFKDDQYSGLGRLELADGSQYQGQFAHGKPNGEGQRNDDSGNQFSGRFVDGQLEGNGTFNSADGDMYIGHFKQNQLNGKGRYENADGDVWIGEFKEGALSGKGELIGVDGSHYVGQFVDWRFTGTGRLNLTDGSFYIGGFDSDSYQGRGTLVLTDGTVQAGTWVNGMRVRDAEGKLLPDPLEIGLFAQGHLLDAALAAVPASKSGVELYTLVVAGDGKQSVFLREADYVSNMLATRFGAYGQIRLVNHRDHIADRPMATRESLRRAVQTLAERSGPQDLVFIYLTSHGTHEHELVLDQPRMELADLPADELAAVLAPLKNRDKIIVISACYSGGFIPALKDEHTLIMTASRADRVSFGCSEEADFTYFGDALFAQAFNQTDDLQQAFKLAQTHVAEREQADNFEASEPQIWAPKGVIAHWQLLRKQQARKALESVSMNSKEAKSN